MAVRTKVASNGSAAASPPPIEQILIPPIEQKILVVPIVGITPLLVCAWSHKAMRQMLEKQMKKAQKGKEAKDPEADYKASLYTSTEGWTGVPAGGIKGALVAACRTVSGLPMTVAKRIVFVQADGVTEDGKQIVRVEGEHKLHQAMVRLESGVADIRFRAIYEKWEMKLSIEFAADMISSEQVCNLVQRAGRMEGLCEHRPGAPKSNTGDFGRFRIVEGKIEVLEA